MRDAAFLSSPQRSWIEPLPSPSALPLPTHSTSKPMRSWRLAQVLREANDSSAVFPTSLDTHFCCGEVLHTQIPEDLPKSGSETRYRLLRSGAVAKLQIPLFMLRNVQNMTLERG